MKKANGAPLAVLFAIAACSPAASLTPTSAIPTDQPSLPVASTAAPSPKPARTFELSAIVGTWHREQTCDELRAAFEAEGLLEAHVDWFNDLCAETQVPTEHSHVFTAGGRFSSHDQNGRQVDDGDYRVTGPGELRFPSHARDLGYEGELVVTFEIDGDVATFDVKVPSACRDGCALAHFWALSAFASGPWERAR